MNKRTNTKCSPLFARCALKLWIWWIIHCDDADKQVKKPHEVTHPQNCVIHTYCIMASDRCKWWSAGVRTNNKKNVVGKNELNHHFRFESNATELSQKHTQNWKKHEFPLKVATFQTWCYCQRLNEWMITNCLCVIHTIQGVSKFGFHIFSICCFAHKLHSRAATPKYYWYFIYKYFEMKCLHAASALHRPKISLWIVHEIGWLFSAICSFKWNRSDATLYNQIPN